MTASAPSHLSSNTNCDGCGSISACGTGGGAATEKSIEVTPLNEDEEGREKDDDEEEEEDDAEEDEGAAAGGGGILRNMYGPFLPSCFISHTFSAYTRKVSSPSWYATSASQ